MSFTGDIRPEVSQRRAADPAGSSWVDASAGSGKTKVLTDRILRLLLSGARPDTILAITFTRAAAAEMRNRLNETLADWATMESRPLDEKLDELYGLGKRDKDAQVRARRLFATIVDAPVGVRIETIHGFCQSVLRRFPLEAGIPPHFGVLDERSADQLKKESVAHVFDRTEAEPALGAAIARLSVAYAETRFAALIREIINGRAKFERAFADYESISDIVARLERAEGIEPGETVLSLLQRSCHDLAVEKELLLSAAKVMQEKGSETYIETGRKIQAWIECDIEGRCASLDEYQTAFLTKGELRKNLINPKLAQSHPHIAEALAREALRVQALLARCNTLGVIRNTEDLLILAEAILGDYERRKRRAALLDFDDQILRTYKLLTERSNEAAAWVLYKLDGGIDHILVDESQDTSPIQWELIKALTDEFFAGEGTHETPRTIFAVGDRKQSIFSFQGADPAIAEEMRGHFQSAVENAQQSWAPVELNVSFRSTKPILSLVDAVFSGGAALAGVAPAPLIHHLHRRGEGGIVELWPLAEKAPAIDEDPWAIEVEPGGIDPVTRTANRIADTIAGWLRDGEILASENRPVRAGDILVLVRKRWPLVPKLIRACKQRGIPVAGADRMILTQELAVTDLMALAQFLLLPEDDMALAIVLRGPLLGLSEDDLFALAYKRKGTLYQALQAATFPAALAARDWLSGWLSRVDFIRPYELFAAVLNEGCPADTSGRRAFAARLGGQALDPLDEFLGAALNFETTHAPSLQNFLHWIETKEVEVKREKDVQGARGEEGEVAIMTVHGAKGLQAPIVFLADTTDFKAAGPQGPLILWQDRGLPLAAPLRAKEDAACRAVREAQKQRAEEEHRRLLYVGLTRAADRLYIASWQGRNAPAETCWHSLIEAALTEPLAKKLPDGVWRIAEPHTNQPKSPQKPRERAKRTLVPDYMRQAPPPEPSPPRPLAPSHFIAVEPASASPLAADNQANRFERGQLIHRLLQTLPQLPPENRTAAARRYIAGASSLDEAQAETLIAEVARVMQDERFTAVFGPHSQAEVPVVGLIYPEGAPGALFALSGQIDRLVVTDEEVLIVDYKTNRPPPSDGSIPEAYRKQLAAYRAAIARLYPEKRIRTALLWTYEPRLTEVLTDV
jgi:ATP-dependent helicase/nuclease subunit A